MSGYNLDSLLPENGFNVARALVGSEGTLVTVLRAELALVDGARRARALVVLGYPDIARAADAVPARRCRTSRDQLEGIDERLVAFERARSASTAKRSTELPGGRAAG